MDSRMQTIQSQRPAMGFIKAGLTLGALLAMVAAPAIAGPREQAKRIHDRLAGVPPTDTILGEMEIDVIGGNADLAAEKAMNNSAFYNVTLKNWAAPWTNRDQTVFVELNDYTATIAGMARDDVPFNTLLSEDIVYVGNANLGLPAYSMANNNHYAQMESQGVDMRTGLTRTTQSSVTSLPPAATAGVMTSRAAAEAFFIAGTNRAMFRFTMLNHLCHDMEQVLDTGYPPDRIRQDVSRSPGGDSRVFMNNCIGCHSGIDPMAQAFAYYNFDETSGSIEYSAGAVHSKYFNNESNFPPGFATPDDAWENRWREGQNALLGWDANLPGSGAGAKSLGQELGNSDAFAECQVTKVFKNVCLREPVDGTDRAQIVSMITNFRSSTYRLKTVFSNAAVYCMGD
jgi:hypothetical protein